ncbi:hypothetical protein EVG20_g1197 [Dentipellis fragilis]|uniref:Uncharacterized protein n=1 Tax=Dentipellis fragilis TaxID=205917 RepID=A0A4Y9ZDG9_9AGAM|nr:hypothetical protein EVG20_g1197 [Dentipellis fragilis]
MTSHACPSSVLALGCLPSPARVLPAARTSGGAAQTLAQKARCGKWRLEGEVDEARMPWILVRTRAPRCTLLSQPCANPNDLGQIELCSVATSPYSPSHSSFPTLSYLHPLLAQALHYHSLTLFIMRIPSSSSVIIASLAVISSSSSLSAMAAPTSDGNGLMDPNAMSAADNSSDGGIQRRQLLNLGAALEGLPIVGPALKPVVDLLGLGGDNPAAVASLPADKLAVAQSVVNTAAANIQAAVKGAAANVPLPVPAAGLPTPPAPLSPPQSGSSTSSAPSTSSGQPTSSPPPGSQPAIAMFSPPLPVNPPNTPVVRMVGLPEGRAIHDAPALEESDIHASISVGKGSSTESAAPTSSSA